MRKAICVWRWYYDDAVRRWSVNGACGVLTAVVVFGR